MNILDAKIAYLFPGQGSQVVGMGKQLAETFPAVRQIFERGDDILGFPISDLAWNGPEETLNDTINTQPALLLHSIAAWKALEQKHPSLKPRFVAGHSLGELSALVVSGALPFEDGLRLVRRRGELMKQAGEQSPGSMAAILGLDLPELDRILTEAASDSEPIQIANDNCPGQVVISGANASIERALALAKEAGARRTVPLPVSIAAHSPLMQHAQADFNQAVQAAPLTKPAVPVIGNVTARPLQSVEDIQDDLQAQLTSRVRWTESVEYMIAEGVDTFVEIGAGNVLCGLVRRINRDVHRIPLGTPEDFLALD